MQNLSKGAAQAGVAIDIARQLETTLEAFGARGKGLHEKTSSVEGKLPEALVKKLRFIASVRNKIVHEDDLMPDDDFSAFAESGQQAMEDLKDAIAKCKSGDLRPKSKARKKASPRPAPTSTDGLMARTGRAIRLGGLVFLGGIAIVFLLMVLGSDGPRLWGGAFVTYFLLGGYFLRKNRRASRAASAGTR